MYINQPSNKKKSHVTLNFDRQPINILQQSEPLYQIDNDAIIQSRVKMLSSNVSNSNNSMKNLQMFQDNVASKKIAENFKRRKRQENQQIFKQGQDINRRESVGLQQVMTSDQRNSSDQSDNEYEADDDNVSPEISQRLAAGFDEKQSKSMQ